jgi:hypothetical protein
MKNKRIKYDFKCTRCGMITSYVRNPITENRSYCKYCKNVPDDLLDIFIRNRKYSRVCKICDGIIFYKNRSAFLSSFGKKREEHKTVRCKSCTSRINASIKTKKYINEWKEITGTVNISKKHLRKIKLFWSKLPENKRQDVLRKTNIQKRHFWSHLSRMKRVLHIKTLKKAFEKYRGDNHWTKTNPEVLKKIKKSCKKYCGDNHWFRNKNYVKKSEKINVGYNG